MALWLVRNNVPFDVALSLYPEEAFAWSVIFSEFEGREFNWNTMTWKKES